MNQYTSAIVGTALQNGILTLYFTDTINMLQVSIYYRNAQCRQYSANPGGSVLYIKSSMVNFRERWS
jgi:hypothetical protein